MKVAKTIREVRAAIAQARQSLRPGSEQAAGTVGLVPTMGALHEGHYSLIDRARGECDFVTVSIFVNPAQFGPNEDLEAYPRTPEADLAGCEHRGVDLVFMPGAEEMHPQEALTTVAVERLARGLCGRSRPTHFPGVCTVVAKLFNIVLPERAYFGAKDFQQAVIIRQMVADLDFPVEIVVCPTVREPDGLAVSSRNAYLTAEERKQATALFGALSLAERMIRRQQPPTARVVEAIRKHLSMHAPDGMVDYAQIVDPEELTDVERTDRPVLVALAVKFGRAVLRSKIHRARITEAQIEYVGSITIDSELMDAVGLSPGQCVLVADTTNGARFETYVMRGKPSSGTICINGAAARLVSVGDEVIIMAFAYVEAEKASDLKPAVALVDENNRMVKKL
ncbi:MAG: pantoate--beta-alanine ligase [Planctomycetota bacterium]|jgi:pantoate--beta-alanine ligase